MDDTYRGLRPARYILTSSGNISVPSAKSRRQHAGIMKSITRIASWPTWPPFQISIIVHQRSLKGDLDLCASFGHVRVFIYPHTLRFYFSSMTHPTSRAKAVSTIKISDPDSSSIITLSFKSFKPLYLAWTIFLVYGISNIPLTLSALRQVSSGWAIGHTHHVF